MATVNIHPMEGRAHRRFIVSGFAETELRGERVLGTVVSFGAGGLLICCDLHPPIDAEIHIDFTIWCSGENFPASARGKVVWTQPGKVGVKFLEAPPRLTELLNWLDREHCCWSGTE